MSRSRGSGSRRDFGNSLYINFLYFFKQLKKTEKLYQENMLKSTFYYYSIIMGTWENIPQNNLVFVLI